MKNDDELLDDIVAYLRSASVPEMPAELTASRSARCRSWMLYATATGVLAASLAAILLWIHAWHAFQSDSPSVAEKAHPNAHESHMVVRPMDLTEPLTQLESGLDMIDAEISELRNKAALLDAQRLVDRLLASH